MRERGTQEGRGRVVHGRGGRGRVYTGREQLKPPSMTKIITRMSHKQEVEDRAAGAVVLPLLLAYF